MPGRVGLDVMRPASKLAAFSACLVVTIAVAGFAGCGDGTPNLDSHAHWFVVNQDGSDFHPISGSDVAVVRQSSGSASFERKGNELVLTWSAPGSPGQVHRVGGFLNAPAYARFSPDGRTLLIAGTRLAGDRRFYLFTVLATGGRLRKISDEVLTEPAAWSPDGKWIATANYDGDVVLLRPDGSDQRVVIHLSGGTASNPLLGSNTVQIDHLGWSRDGGRIFFSAYKVPPET
jgi:Tol biopolymer transport system component